MGHREPSRRVCAQRPRLPRGCPRSTLRRWCGARPGSGWSGVLPHRSRPRAHATRRKDASTDGLDRRGRLCCACLLGGRARSEVRTGLGHEDGLAPVGYPLSTGRLATGSSPRGLTPVWGGTAHLGVGFPLRCCQRLSRPDMATQRCRLADNWHTSGPSSPVLSY
jgi:hypothetical protein